MRRAASLDGLYVILEFPTGSAFTGCGEGGGPAVGFSDGLTGPSGWISGDGETWHRLAGDFGFAMAPVLVPFEEGMAVKSLGEPGDDVPDVPEEYYVKLAPMLLFFTAKWCVPCRIMKRDVVADPDVAQDREGRVHADARQPRHGHRGAGSGCRR